MNLGSILIGIAILVITIPFVMNPIVNERKKKPVKTASTKKEANGQQKDALAVIRDLDFDFQTGKVTQEDYESLRAQLVLEAAQFLQMKREEEEKIETMIRARQQQMKAPDKCEKCGGEIRSLDRFCPICGAPAKNQVKFAEPVAQTTCPGCGKIVLEGDLFCTSCGTKVNVPAKPGKIIPENEKVN